MRDAWNNGSSAVLLHNKTIK